ncbi:MAG: T9SS type A sorting domain-containing protein [Flavobacterium sp.]
MASNDSADGKIIFWQHSPEGIWTITYKISQKSCPDNYSIATATVRVGYGGYAKTVRSAKELSKTVTIYPNPSSGIFNMDLTNVEENYSNIKVFNMLGSTIYEGNLSRSLNQIDLSNVPTGCYFVHVFNGENSIQIKLIKQ